MNMSFQALLVTFEGLRSIPARSTGEICAQRAMPHTMEGLGSGPSSVWLIIVPKCTWIRVLLCYMLFVYKLFLMLKITIRLKNSKSCWIGPSNQPIRPPSSSGMIIDHPVGGRSRDGLPGGAIKTCQIGSRLRAIDGIPQNPKTPFVFMFE